MVATSSELAPCPSKAPSRGTPKKPVLGNSVTKAAMPRAPREGSAASTRQASSPRPSEASAYSGSATAPEKPSCAHWRPSCSSMAGRAR
jgi:hypothetical protein